LLISWDRQGFRLNLHHHHLRRLWSICWDRRGFLSRFLAQLARLWHVGQTENLTLGHSLKGLRFISGRFLLTICLGYYLHPHVARCPGLQMGNLRTLEAFVLAVGTAILLQVILQATKILQCAGTLSLSARISCSVLRLHRPLHRPPTPNELLRSVVTSHL
jgi:hypothetical protein